MTNALTPQTRNELFRSWLAGLDDAGLGSVLSHRWDTLLPTPPGISSLAVRLLLRGSLAEAIKHINALELAIIEIIAGSGGGLEPLDSPEILRQLRRIAKDQGYRTAGLKGLVDSALIHLRELALVFPVATHNSPIVATSSSADTAVTASGWLLADDLTAVIPQGLHVLPDEPFISAEQARELVENLDEHSRRIIDTLLRSGGHGITKDASPTADPNRPIPKLIASGVLVRVSENAVRLPSGIKDALSGRESIVIPLLPPDPTVEDPASPHTHETAAGTGLEMIRLLRSLIERLEHQPVALLKDRVVGVRAMSSLAGELGCSEPTLARLISLAMAAGLVGTGVPDPLPDADDLGDYLCSTTLVDDWTAAPLHIQWAWVLHHWVARATMRSWLIGQPDERGKPLHLLHPATFSDGFPKVRQLLLGQLAQGGAVTAAELRERVNYAAPVQASKLALLTFENVLEEAVFVGAVEQVADRVHATSILSESLTSAAHWGTEPSADLQELAHRLTPPTTKQLIIQADHTVLAPGPVPRDMQVVLGASAEVESAGLASVFRITQDSVARAFDAGYTEQELIDFYTSHVPGELPDTVSYLITDTARKHGNLRGGPALSYIRCEDQALLAQACATKAAKAVALRCIAPTVAIAQAPLGKVIELLREEGFHPSAEDATGASIDVRPPASRVKYKEPAASPAPFDPTRINTAIAAIRRADGTGSAPHSSHDYRSFFLAAIRKRQSARVSFIDNEGTTRKVRVTPIAVTGGQVSAADLATGVPVVFQLENVISATII